MARSVVAVEVACRKPASLTPTSTDAALIQEKPYASLHSAVSTTACLALWFSEKRSLFSLHLRLGGGSIKNNPFRPLIKANGIR
jgi:hypothetical protein